MCTTKLWWWWWWRGIGGAREKLMLGKGNQGMKSGVATDRIRPMARPLLHSMCEHSPPIESVVLGKQRARHFPSADFKDDNYWTSGNRVQTIAPTLSISHTWCRQNQRGRTLHKQSRGLWSLLAGWVLQEVCEWNRLAGSQSTCFATRRKRTRYIFSHFRQFLRLLLDQTTQFVKPAAQLERSCFQAVYQPQLEILQGLLESIFVKI